MLLGITNGRMIRIAVFFDGDYFYEPSQYYKFGHKRQSRLDVSGIQEFIRHKVAECEKCDVAQCQIVEAHYFRGRFSTRAAERAGKLKDERRFDEILMRAGIVQHYLPIDETRERPTEKGIDVWLSLEAFDLAVHKRFDVVALLACDGDYVPLVRKLNGIGTRVMLLAWNFQYEVSEGDKKRLRETRTSAELIKLASYPLKMDDIIGLGFSDDPLVNGIFVSERSPSEKDDQSR
ncbi:MAG: hypothetical protein KatS3mg109_0300 [Pirellulaceae bacterium]|nr:MAG: hypothetical protein KatS3mg109_0300 [Pirellulaceae bacterium]